MEEKLGNMVTILIFVWVFAWTPYAVFSLWIMIDDSLMTPGIALVPILACKTSAGLNAFFYGLR